MRKRIVYIILCCLIGFSGAAYGQSGKMKRAQRYMDLQKFDKAVSIYLEILEKSEYGPAMMKVADAYRQKKDYDQAEQWYEKILQLPEAEPVHFFQYAQMLRFNGKCELAQKHYLRFLRMRPYDSRRNELQNMCDFVDELRNSMAGYYEVTALPVNTELADLGPSFYRNGLVYSSIRPIVNDRELPFFDLHFVPFKAGNNPTGSNLAFGESQSFAQELNSTYHEAKVSFNKEETEIYLTRTRQDPEELAEEAIIRLEIVYAVRDRDRWSQPNHLPFNSTEYSVAHPSLTPDGMRLFFSSDMPGGFGGKDLYVSYLEDAAWGRPINLGPEINTEGDEVFPFYHPAGHLYFSSDGQIGLGGQDLFMVEDLGNGQWTKVENLGYPLNTEYNDYGMIVSEEGQYGFFTSDRPGGKGSDDIYSYSLKDITLEVSFTDSKSKAPLSGVSISGEGGKTGLTDAKGVFRFALSPGECLRFAGVMEDYQAVNQEVCAGDYKAGDVVQVNIPLKKIGGGPVYNLVGTVRDQVSGEPVPDVNISLNGAESRAEIFKRTDKNGEFKITLRISDCYQLIAGRPGFFTHSPEQLICTKDQPAGDIHLDIHLQPIGQSTSFRTDRSVEPKEAEPKKEEKEPAKRTVNDFTVSTKSSNDDDIVNYLLNVYYDVGRSSVNAESVTELYKLLDFLKDNPNLILEIRSHTDNTGSPSLNQKLSQRRADAIVDWLLKQGIDRQRLSGVGYGETKPVVECPRAEDCNEAQHQMNRRTEFRVLGELE